MPKLSIVLPVLNENQYLPKALDSLIHQTDEDFEVIIADGGSTDGSADTAREACEKYVGFYFIQENFQNRFEAMNRSLKSCEGDYVLFHSARDFITDETVEKLSELIEQSEKKPDVIVFRNYIFGEGILPVFSEYDDKLAPLPSVPKYDNLFLRSFFLGNKCYRRSFLENNHLHFGTQNTYEDYFFVYDAFLRSRLTVGCPYAFCEQRVNAPSEGFSARNLPTKENFLDFCRLFERIYHLAGERIAEDSDGHIDGQESYLQEVIYRFVCMLYERFYAKLWYMDDEVYQLFAETYNEWMRRLNKEKTEKLKKLYGYLGAPYIFESRRSVDYLCLLALDFPAGADYNAFLASLYHQSFPFFEVTVRADAFRQSQIREEYAAMPNFHIIEDSDYFPAARALSSSRMVLVVKEGTPLYEHTLKEVSESHALVFLRQSVFSKIRKSAEMKRTLKEKGLNI